MNEDSNSNASLVKSKIALSSSMLTFGILPKKVEPVGGGEEGYGQKLHLPLDQAILKSIDACPSEDIKKKMYTTILVVGGGFKFKMADRFLLQKLALQV